MRDLWGIGVLGVEGLEGANRGKTSNIGKKPEKSENDLKSIGNSKKSL